VKSGILQVSVDCFTSPLTDMIGFSAKSMLIE